MPALIDKIDWENGIIHETVSIQIPRENKNCAQSTLE